MKPDRLSRHLLISFGIATVLYVTLYWFIEHRRVAQTPWMVSYEVDASGHAKLEISQQSLGLGPVEIRFSAATTNAALPRTQVIFRYPNPVPRAMPLGRCIFEDLTFLPGTVALNLADTDIQMLPRALTIGTNEFSWRRVRNIEVRPDGSSNAVP